MTNKQKAENMTKGFLKEGLIKKSRIQELLIKAMDWKDKQFENAIKEFKANIIESRDNKEYYETNRETMLNWVLRLIDECCEGK